MNINSCLIYSCSNRVSSAAVHWHLLTVVLICAVNIHSHHGEGKGWCMWMQTGWVKFCQNVMDIKSVWLLSHWTHHGCIFRHTAFILYILCNHSTADEMEHVYTSWLLFQSCHFVAPHPILLNILAPCCLLSLNAISYESALFLNFDFFCKL